MEKKELNGENLEKVSGGIKWVNFPSNLSAYLDYTVYVSKYDGIVGNKYLFKKDDINWVFGTLSSSYENGLFGFSERIHDVKVEDCHGFELPSGNTPVTDYGTMEISGDEYIIYAKA